MHYLRLPIIVLQYKILLKIPLNYQNMLNDTHFVKKDKNV